MSTTSQFQLNLHVHPGIRSEEGQAAWPRLPANRAAPALESFEISDGSLPLGLSEDGRPILLDLYDPGISPLLVTGDAGSGKTVLLQSLARFSGLPDPGDLQFGVLTSCLEEWRILETWPNCLGIWPTYHPSASHLLAQLVYWAEILPRTRQAVMLLIDGLDLTTSRTDQFHNNLRWLLSRGPACRVWPVVTISSTRLSSSQPWLAYFHTRVIGRVKQVQLARTLINTPGISLPELIPSQQYVISQKAVSQKFTLPLFDQGD